MYKVFRKLHKGKWKKNLPILGVLGLSILLAGVDSCPKGINVFNHRVHIEELEMSCNDCHTPSQDGAKMEQAKVEGCFECHQEGEKEYAEIVKAMKEGKVNWPSASLLYGDELIFSHQTHTDKKIDCHACHGNMSKNKKVTEANLPSMASCMQCHEKQGIANDCKTCHKQIRQDAMPPSHDVGWKWVHGQVVDKHGFDDIEEVNCSHCHTQSTCTQCHQQEPPRDHNTFWRLRGHAIDAGVDRNQCTTCHQTDFCIRCHQNASPVTHQGAWGSPMNQHCIFCHDGSTSSGCYTCHQQGAPSHFTQSPPLPATVPAHGFSNTCLNCHTIGPNAVRHPTNGGDGAYCRSCHR